MLYLLPTCGQSEHYEIVWDVHHQITTKHASSFTLCQKDLDSQATWQTDRIHVYQYLANGEPLRVWAQRECTTKIAHQEGAPLDGSYTHLRQMRQENKKEHFSTLTGLEPARDKPSRFLVDRLNHSATVSSLLCWLYPRWGSNSRPWVY